MCCRLFGCGDPGLLEAVCLARLVARAAEPLPDIRIDLPASAPADAVWLTTAPVDVGKQFLVEIRPAAANDRRSRTQPHWMGDARLHVFALGRTRVECREGSLEGKWLEQRAGQLLKYLICERRRVVYPGEIAAALWDSEDAHPASTVRYFVHRLRRQVEPEPPSHGPSSFILGVQGGYKLAGSVQVDADQFEAEVAAGLAQQDPSDAGARLAQAITIYRDDFLADLPGAAWAFDERERLRTLAESALRRLLHLELDKGDRQGALGRLRRLVQLQPFELDLHRQLLALYLRCGRRSEALRRYSALEVRFRDEFGEDLDFDLESLALEEVPRALNGHPAGARGVAG